MPTMNVGGSPMLSHARRRPLRTSSVVCIGPAVDATAAGATAAVGGSEGAVACAAGASEGAEPPRCEEGAAAAGGRTTAAAADRKSTRLNSSHQIISYA